MMAFRTASKKVGDEWVACEFEALRTGDQFRLYDSSERVFYIGTLMSDPVPCAPEGNWEFEAVLEEVE